MAKSKRVTYFKARIENRPGALLAVAEDLKTKNLDLLGLKGLAHAGEGEILVIAKDPEKLREAWASVGMLIEEGTAFYISGEDKTGALAASLDALAKAGVNLAAIEAVAAGGKFGSILWVAPEDLDKTAQALEAS